MKTNLRLILSLGAIALFTLTLAAFSLSQDPWSVPDKYKNMKNTTGGKDSDGVGEELYAQHCKSCHGKEGFGDGTKAKELKTEMRDLSSKEVQSQTDGVLYYKGIIGRDEMPNFEKKIGDVEDRWMVVNYIRTMAE
ncbi:MAG TPA: cytochrome C [Flavobacteriales bacterium]|nr:cytochrome C [Flavobacteriales bacterium]